MGANNGIVEFFREFPNFVSLDFVIPPRLSPTCISTTIDIFLPISYDIILPRVFLYYCCVSELVLLYYYYYFFLNCYRYPQLITWSPGGSIIKLNNMITNTSAGLQHGLKFISIWKWFFYLTVPWKSTLIYDLRATRVPFRLIRHSIFKVIMFLLYCDLVLTTTLVACQHVHSNFYDGLATESSAAFLFNCRSRSIG